MKNKNGEFIPDLFFRECIDNDEKLRDKFVDLGFLIDDNYDEILALENRIKNNITNDSELIVHVNPTLDCNMHCWYCYEKHQKQSVMEADVKKSVVRYFELMLKNDPKIRSVSLGFFGGEPFLHYNDVVEPLIQEVTKLCRKRLVKISINFTTNGTLLTEKIINRLSEFKPSFQITFDGNEFNHNRTRPLRGKNSYRTLINNIVSLAQKDSNVLIRINYTSEVAKNLEDLFKDFRIFKEKGLTDRISIDFQRVWQERDSYDSTDLCADEVKRMFIKDGFHISDSRIMNYVQQPCYGDMKNYLPINYNGDIFGCTARDFTSDNRIGKLNRDGSVIYDSVLMRKREISKFSKGICRQCRIAPLCGGGCTQRALETFDSKECTYGFTEKDKNDIVIHVFEKLFTKP